MAAKKRCRPGRPYTDPRGKKEARVQLRSLPEELEAWVAAAARRTIGLSDWAREHLNRAAKRENP